MYGLMCVSRTLKHGRKKHTEAHALAYLKYVTIASLTMMAKLVAWESLIGCNIRYKVCLVVIVTYFK